MSSRSSPAPLNGEFTAHIRRESREAPLFYQPDAEQPIQLVINDITKDHVHGYVKLTVPQD